MKKTLMTLTTLTATLGLMAPGAEAATIVGSVSTAVGDAVLTDNDTGNDPDPGTGDWRVWLNTVAAAGSDEKSGGSQISDLATSGVTSSAFNDTVGASLFAFDWVDGTSTAIGTDVGGGLQSNAGSGGIGDGYSMDITLNSTSGFITLWLGVRKTTGQLDVTSDQGGGVLYTDNSVSDLASNAGGVYTLTFSDAVVGEKLTIDWTLDDTSLISEDWRLRVYGAAIDTAIPEPASLALVGLGGLLMLGRSRRAV